MEVQQSRTDLDFEIVRDCSYREVEDADAPIGVRQEYTFILREALQDDTYLAFYTVHQYVDVRLDGQNVYSLKPSEQKKISKTVGWRF